MDLFILLCLFGESEIMYAGVLLDECSHFVFLIFYLLKITNKISVAGTLYQYPENQKQSNIYCFFL